MPVFRFGSGEMAAAAWGDWLVVKLDRKNPTAI
jgi:hypothetical protein